MNLSIESFVLDFSCVHAYGSKHIQTGHAFDRVSVFESLSKVKHDAYDAIADYGAKTFVPFLLNTHGAMGAEAVAFCRKLAIFASEFGAFKPQWEEDSAYTFIINSVATSIHSRLQEQIDSYVTIVRTVNGL